jgi:hypothetical protein
MIQCKRERSASVYVYPIYATDVREANQDPKLRQRKFLIFFCFWSTMQEREEHHLRLT